MQPKLINIGKNYKPSYLKWDVSNNSIPELLEAGESWAAIVYSEWNMLDKMIFSFAVKTGDEKVNVIGKLDGDMIKSIKFISLPSSSGRNFAPKR